MARQRTQTAISLFPFLAVLVCTMGALILLLLVTTRRIRHDQQVVADVAQPADIATQPAVASVVEASSESQHAHHRLVQDIAANFLEERWPKSAEADSAKVPRLKLQLPEVNPFAATNDTRQDETPAPASIFDLQSDVDRLQAELIKETRRHGELLAEIERARLKMEATEGEEVSGREMQELAALRRQQAELAGELKLRAEHLHALQQELEVASKAMEDGEQVLKRRESALISLRKLAMESQQQSAAGIDKTVVEFTNATGTQRAPVIVNVTGDGYELLPSGIKITKGDMEGFPGNDNPLLSGVLAVHHHRHAATLSVKPYVLLVVRPDGSLPFYTAQRTFTDADIHFGYELLDQNKQIDAGRRDSAEVAAVRDSLIAALNRRTNLYGGLMADVRELLQQQEQTQSRQTRQARVMPDGRIVMPGEDGDGFDGRFYAGGESKPQRIALMPKRSPFAEQSAEPARPPAATDSQETTSIEAENRQTTAEWLKLIDEARSGNVRVEQTAEEPTTTGNSFANDGEIANATAVATPTDDVDEPSMGNRNAGNTFTRPAAISGNMGVGGDVGRDTFGGSETSGHVTGVDAPSMLTGPLRDSQRTGKPESPNTLFSTPVPVTGSKETGEEAAAERFNPAWLNNTDPAAASSPQTLAGDDSQATNDWPSSSDASSEQASRTVNSPENSSSFNFTDESAATAFAAPSAEVAVPQTTDRPTEGTVGAVGLGTPFGADQDGQLTGAAPASDSQLMLQKFLQQLEHEKQNPEADPFLLALLKKGQHSEDGRLEGRYPVDVLIDQNQLTIGNYRPIDITGWDDQQILAATLEGLAAEMDQQKPRNTRYALPMVDFKVGRDAWTRQNRLAKQLDEMDVPTRSVQNTIGNEAARPQSLTPPPSGESVPATGFNLQPPTREPAEPIEVTAPQRRMSI